MKMMTCFFLFLMTSCLIPSSDAIILDKFYYGWRWLRQQMYRLGARRALQHYRGQQQKTTVAPHLRAANGTNNGTTISWTGNSTDEGAPPLALLSSDRPYGQPPAGQHYPQPLDSGSSFLPYAYQFQQAQDDGAGPENHFALPPRIASALSEEKFEARNASDSQPPLELLFPASFDGFPPHLLLPPPPEGAQLLQGASAEVPQQGDSWWTSLGDSSTWDDGHYRQTWTGDQVVPLAQSS